TKVFSCFFFCNSLHKRMPAVHKFMNHVQAVDGVLPGCFAKGNVLVRGVVVASLAQLPVIGIQSHRRHLHTQHAEATALFLLNHTPIHLSMMECSYCDFIPSSTMS